MIFNLARTMQSLQALSCKRYITMKIYKLKIINYSHVLKSAQKWLIQFPKTRSKQSPSMMLKVTLPSQMTVDPNLIVSTSKRCRAKQTVIASNKRFRHLAPKTITQTIKMSFKIYQILRSTTKTTIETVMRVNSLSWSLAFKIYR